jgi:fermentation-respiration switch protein FrsA (DUF1100 family)
MKRARKIALLVLLGVPTLIYCGICVKIGLGQRQMLYGTNAPGAGNVVSGAQGFMGPASQVIPDSEAVTLTTADGEKLAAWYVAPQPGQRVKLFLHGQGGRLAVQSNRWRRTREAGLGLLAVSYRGYPGSTGSPTEDGLHLDARAAYDWLRQRHAARDIVLHGQSLGSGVAVRLAAEVEVGAVILEAPFTAAVDVAAERFPWLPVRWLMLDQFRSRDHIGEVKAPVMIVHGDSDSIIPFAHGERLYALAREPKQFVRMPGSDHNTLVRDGLYEKIGVFLAGLR